MQWPLPAVTVPSPYAFSKRRIILLYLDCLNNAHMLRSLLLRAACLVPLSVSASTTLVAQMPIPMDNAVRVGRLPNGLRYYVRRNARPENRLELRLVVNAGSIVEDDDQRGMAHFVEHMLFNGTRRFKKNDIITYLESIGVRFGADLNAVTGFDETMYMLPVPTDKPGLVDRAFDILEDWASAASFDSIEVVNERGVVLEEWRSKLGASSRIRDKQLPVIFQGSKYADRLPIGLPQSIEGANPSPLKRFYRDWYRPDLMAVVAVGDVDPLRLERAIRSRFAKLPRAAKPRARSQPAVPGNAEPLVSIVSDPEEQVSSVGVLYKRAPDRVRTEQDYRRSLVAELYNDMLNRRLGEIARRPDAPFSLASSGYGSFVRGADAYQLAAVAKENKTADALGAVLAEAKRVREHGFLTSEFERAKVSILRSYESAYAERNKTESGDYVGEYVQHFLTGEPSPGIAWEYRAVQRLMPTIKREEVDALGRSWLTDSNRVVTLSAPESQAKVPTPEELLGAFQRAQTAAVAPWTENVSDAPIVPSPPRPGRVTREATIAELGVTDWTLSNGIRVLVKPTDFKADEVLIRGFGSGGTSLTPDVDFPSAALATTAVERGGLGEFDAIALGKKLTGKQVRVSPFLGDGNQGIAGSGSPKDIETLFQLIYARLMLPRRDSAAFEGFKNQIKPFLQNRGTSPEAAFSDTITVTMAQGHPRAEPINAALLDRVNLDKALAIYRDRFADFSGYTFVVAGSVTLASVKPLVEQWLGALPARGTPAKPRDTGIRPPSGRISKVVQKGVEPKAQTVTMYTGPATFSAAERYAIRSVSEYAEMKLLERLREALGGTYSVSVGGGLEQWPAQRFQVVIQYGSAPDRVDSLDTAVRSVLDSIKAGAITEADVAKIREQQLRALEVSLKENGYWLSNIAGRIEYGEDPRGLTAYRDFIRGLTKEALQAAARKYFAGDNVARFVLVPQKPNAS